MRHENETSFIQGVTIDWCVYISACLNTYCYARSITSIQALMQQELRNLKMTWHQICASYGATKCRQHVPIFLKNWSIAFWMRFWKMYFPRRALERTPKNGGGICRLSGKFRRLNRGPKAAIGGSGGAKPPQLECGGLGGASPPMRGKGLRGLGLV